MPTDALRTDDDPRGDPGSAARRPAAASPERWRWPALGRLERVGVLLVVVALLLTVAIELGGWLIPGVLGRVMSPSWHESVHRFGHYVQGAAALAILAAAASWLWQGGLRRVDDLARASAVEGAIESMSAGLAVYGADDRLIACNPSYRRLYPEVAHLLVPGAAHEQLLRAYYPVAVPALSESRTLEQYIGERLRRRQPDEPFTDRVRYLHGQWVMMSDCRTPDGGMISLRSVLSEQQLRSLPVSRQRRAMEDLADLTRDGFWRTDAAHRLVEVSPAAVVMSGRTEEDLIGRAIDDLGGFWSDKDQLRPLGEHVRRREPFPWFRFRIEVAEGKTTWLAACGKPVLNADGSFDGYYGAVRDISEAENTILALRRDEERFRALARLVTEWYWETDASLRYTLVKGSAEFAPTVIDEMIGQPFGQSAIGRVDDDDRRAALAAMQRREPLLALPLRVRYADRADRVFEISAEPMFRGETFVGYRGLSADVTERSALIERLVASEARFRALTELSSDWYWEMDAELRFTRVEHGLMMVRHPAHLRPDDILGRRRWELGGELIHPASWDEHRATLEARRPFRDVVVRRTGRDGSFRYVASSGDPTFDAQGRFTGYRGVAKDITEQVRARENIERLATVDSLTGLANRHAFDERVRFTLAQARADGMRCALLFVDLDNFRLLNNGYGHRAGDEVLRVVAGRLQQEIPEPRLLGRRGGDELVALICDVRSPDAVVELAQQLIRAISVPMPVLGIDLIVTPSIGISYFPQDGVDLEALVNAADAAMYEAKQNGRATYALYTPAVARRVDLRLRLEQRLRKAIESREFGLFFQPTVSLADGCIVGAEVLVRWTDAEVGEVSPAEFIPIAEESGLVATLGDWVLREACKARQAWRAMGLAMPPVAVNVAGVHLRQAGYVESLLDTLAEHEVPATEIEIEVTETGLLDTSETVRANLGRLRRAGVRLALDDFGVGFSSLAHLRDLPIHRLKIDRSFTVECMRDARTLTIVKAVIEMARALGIRITAEGVETQAQQNWMRQLGCDSAQGYLFSRPLTSEEFTRILVEQRDTGRERSLMH
jgi:diguanylate cyclase (GGDEF)-like protein/PAS domain S-box-containing protein